MRIQLGLFLASGPAQAWIGSVVFVRGGRRRGFVVEAGHGDLVEEGAGVADEGDLLLSVFHVGEGVGDHEGEVFAADEGGADGVGGDAGEGVGDGEPVEGGGRESQKQKSELQLSGAD